MEQNKNQIPFPDVLKWCDILKGLGQVGVGMVVDLVTKQITHEGLSNHIPEPTPEYDHYAPLRKDLGV